MSEQLTSGTPWRVIVVFAIPLMLGNIVQQLYHFVDAIVVSRTLGVEALAAVGSTTSLIFLVLGFSWGLTTGFAIPTAQAYGARDHDAVRRSVATGAVLTLAISIVLTAFGSTMARFSLELLGTPPTLLDDATTFARITFYGVVSLMFYNFLAATIRAIGDSRTPLVFLMISCVLNAVLVVAFIAGLGFGIGGAALATILAQLTSVLMCMAHVRRKVPVLRLQKVDWRIRRAAAVGQLRLGVPLGLQTSVIALGSVAVQSRLNSLGPDVVAAFTTYTRVDGLAVTLLASIGLAVTTFVAQNYGAGRPDRVRQGVRQALWVSLGAAILLGLVLFSTSQRIVTLFVSDRAPEVVDLATLPLHINASLYWILGVLFVLRGALQGLGRTAIPFLTGVMELGMRLFTAIALGAAFGYAGVVWGTPLAWTGAVTVLIPAYLHTQRHVHDPQTSHLSDSPGTRYSTLPRTVRRYPRTS